MKKFLLFIAPLIACLFLSMGLAQADQNYGYVYTSSSELCVLGTQASSVTGGDIAHFSSAIYVNGPSNCNYTGAQLGPDYVSLRQEIWMDSYFGEPIYECNNGVRVANDWYYAHTVSTYWDVKGSNIGCQATTAQHYQIHTYYYIYDPYVNGGTWVGGELWSTPIQVSP